MKPQMELELVTRYTSVPLSIILRWSASQEGGELVIVSAVQFNELPLRTAFIRINTF